MTAEIAIFNKTAVALAADSAISIGDGTKIFNTANKLFSLSKYHPVGIMIYGSAQIMGIPWETVIKDYRGKLGTKCFDRLDDYATDFLDFVAKARNFFPEEEQEKHFALRLDGFFNIGVQEILKKIDAHIKEKKSISDAEAESVIASEITRIHNEFKLRPELSAVPKEFPEEVVQKYSKLYDTKFAEKFEKLPVTAGAKAELRDVFKATLSRDNFYGNASGVVVAGFGDKDFFPACKTHLVDSVIHSKLRYAECMGLCGAITFDQGALIMPFAQSEMAHTFIRGADPEFLTVIRSYMEQVLLDLPEIMTVGIDDVALKEKMVAAVQAHREAILQKFEKQMQDHSQRQYSGPIVDAVAALPKDDLAAMAEAVVNLTSFKRKVTMGQRESVGGPIDVAVISKADGFIWIKRKHYFQPELNQHFMRNYYREEEKNG